MNLNNTVSVLAQKREISFRGIIILGTILRLILMPFTAHPFDVYAWYRYCRNIIKFGVNINIVLSSLRPLWFLTLIPIALIYYEISKITNIKAISVHELPEFFNPHYGVDTIIDPLFAIIVKTPSLLADIGTVFLLNKIIKKFATEKLSKKAAFLFYLNPLSIWITGAWGQYESIVIFFTFLSIYLLLGGRIILSALSLCTAFLYKIYPLIALIPILGYLYRKYSFKILIIYFLIFFSPFLICIVLGKYLMIEKYINEFIFYMFSSKSFYGIYGFGLTYWSISLILPLDNFICLIFSLILMSILLLCSFLIIIRRNFEDPLKDISVCVFMLTSSIFLSYRIVAETRLAWLIPFLVIMVLEEIISIKEYYFIVTIAFLYTQKNFPYYLLPLVVIDKNIIYPLFNITKTFRRVSSTAVLPSFSAALILATLGSMFSVAIFLIFTRILMNFLRK